MNLRATDHPEFDAWRWNEYWVPLDVVIEFKRGVYEMALTELARYLPRVNHHNRFLRGGLRSQRHCDGDALPGDLDDHGDHEDHMDHEGREARATEDQVPPSPL